MDNNQAAKTCIACRSPQIEVSELMSTSRIAECWIRTNGHGGQATADDIANFVQQDIGADFVEILRCRSCKIEFANPARTWKSEHYPHEEHGLGWDHQEALRVLRQLPKGSLLDIGCADGQFLKLASDLGHTVTGVDFSVEDVAEARRRGFDAYVGDLSEGTPLVQKGKKFDVITMFQVIEHLEQPDELFNQIDRIAEPNGSFMVGCPSHLRYTRAYPHVDRIGRSDFWDYPPQHSLRWTPSALKAFLSRHGWQTTVTKFEPLAVLGAAAHLTALRGHGTEWYRNALGRRAVTGAWLFRLALDRLGRLSSGIRLFAFAKRAAAPA